jgi:hypothetical protein
MKRSSIAAIGPVISLAIFSFLTFTRANSEERKSEEKSRPTLEVAYQAWQKGLSSDKKEEREKTLRSMLPTKADVAHLFPKHADKLWPQFDQMNQLLLKNVDPVAKEVAGGEAAKVTAIDLQKEDAKKPGTHHRLLTMIPGDVPVYRIVRQRQRGPSGSGTYVFLNNRWIWIRGLEGVPEVIDQLK